MALPQLTREAVRLELDGANLRLFVRTADRWCGVMETGPAGGFRLRTDADVPMLLREGRVSESDVRLVLTAEGVVAALTATPRPDAAAVDVVVSLTLADAGDMEWWWSDWLFLPDGRALGRPPAHAFVPQLRPDEAHLIADHCLRSGTMTVQDGPVGVVFQADLGAQAAAHPLRTAFDYRADGDTPRLSYGVIACDPEEHMFFRHAPGATQRVPAHPVRLAFTLYLLDIAREERHPLVAARAAAWAARPETRSDRVAPQTLPWADYARAAYPAVLERSFVATPEAGRDTGGVPHWIYPDYIPFQCWFNNLRSGYGLAAWGTTLQVAAWRGAAHRMLTGRAANVTLPHKQTLGP